MGDYDDFNSIVLIKLRHHSALRQKSLIEQEAIGCPPEFGAPAGWLDKGSAVSMPNQNNVAVGYDSFKHKVPTILVGDDNEVALNRLLQASERVGANILVCLDFARLLGVAANTDKIDTVLMDTCIPFARQLESIDDIRRVRKNTPVIYMASGGIQKNPALSKVRGISAVLDKDMDPEKLLMRVLKIASDNPSISKAQIQNNVLRPKGFQITNFQRSIAEALLEGCDTAEIARDFGLPTPEIGREIRALMRKFGVVSRIDLLFRLACLLDMPQGVAGELKSDSKLLTTLDLPRDAS